MQYSERKHACLTEVGLHIVAAVYVVSMQKVLS